MSIHPRSIRSWVSRVLVAGALCLLATAGLANDVLINADAAGWQGVPAVAHQSTGEMVVVWAGGGGLEMRRYDANSDPIDADNVPISVDNVFIVEDLLDVDMNDQGDAVVVWQNGLGGDSEVMACLIPFDGVPSEPFMVNIVTNGRQGLPSVGVGPGGDFVVVYESATIDGSSTGIVLRRYDAAGTPLGGEEVVNTATQGAQSFPIMARNSLGVFVVGWLDMETNTVYKRIYEADGTPRTDPFPAFGGFDEAIAISDQGMIGIVTGFGDIFGGVYDDQGNFVASGIQLNDMNEFAAKPSITALASGDFQVAWTFRPDFNEPEKDIYTRRMDADGTLPEPSSKANRGMAGVQFNSDIDGREDDRYTIVFQGPDGDLDGVFATCLQADGCPDVFADGFESGETLAWDTTLP